MAQGKPEWPEIGALVIATIETVTDYGAYAKLADKVVSSGRNNGLAH